MSVIQSCYLQFPIPLIYQKNCISPTYVHIRDSSRLILLLSLVHMQIKSEFLLQSNLEYSSDDHQINFTINSDTINN